jgi:hypothetical protein
MPSSGIWRHVSCKNQRFGVTSPPSSGWKESASWKPTGIQLPVTVNIFPSSRILVALKMEAIRSSETSVLSRVTRCHIPEVGIFRSHCREILKCYTVMNFADVWKKVFYAYFQVIYHYVTGSSELNYWQLHSCCSPSRLDSGEHVKPRIWIWRCLPRICSIFNTL